jgi:hypothetical protein
MCAVITFIVVLGIMPLAAPSQGTVYFSNLGESGTGLSVENGAQSFLTGINSDGYILNSVTLLMGQWAGNASNFSVSIYSDITSSSNPHTTLSGDADPETAGQYVYTTSGAVLNPDSTYWIVATCQPGSSVSPVGYTWQFTSSQNFVSGDGWNMGASIINADASAPPGSHFQFAVNATPVPEPSVFGILILSGLVFRLRSSR